MANDERTRAEQIAKARGVQSREAAIKHVRKRLASYRPKSETDPDKEAALTQSEPLPVIEYPDPPPPPTLKPKRPTRDPSNRPPRSHPPHKTKNPHLRIIEGGKSDPKSG